MKKKILLCLLLYAGINFSQEKQPKIGLVLSGGGAKGFAHVGVLKEIDKAGLQIDYIAGTSMGAIIGGLYASGYTALEIEKLIKEINFTDILRDKFPRKASPFFEKEYEEKTSITLPVTKGKIGIPKSVSKGQSVLSLFYELLDSTEEINDFSKLPIPFFCIGTDVETGSEILLEKGSLPLAIRASGSFPTLLDPVEVDGKLLVDGGITNNFPISIMKSKGMDIIIGVDVQGNLKKKENLTSVIAILNQIVSYQTYNKSNEEKKLLDFYIHPDVYDYSVVDFDKKDEILQKGDKIGAKFAKAFKELADKQIKKKDKKNVENFKYRIAKRKIDSIEIKGSNNYTRAYVLGKLKIKVGDSLSRKDITERIQFLSTTQNYNRIDYRLKSMSENSYILEFNLKEANENASLSFGAHYDLLYRSSILVNYKHKHLLRENDLLSLDLIIGDNVRYNLHYFVDNGFYFSYGLNSRYNHFRDNANFALSALSQNTGIKINFSYSDFTNQLFAQTTFNRKFAAGIGVEHKYLNVTTPTILNNNNQESTIDRSHYYSGFGYLKYDTYDQPYFVTKGFKADLNIKWVFGSSDYNNNFRKFALAYGKIGFATTFWDRLTLQLTNEAGFTSNNPDSEIFDFYLGGYNQNYINNFVSLYGYDFAEVSDKSYVKAEFNFRYRFSQNHYATFIANYARLDNNVFDDIDIFSNVLSGYALGYSYNSLLGPIELKYSWSPEQKQHFWLFNLGLWF